jgi:hypothetical protein
VAIAADGTAIVVWMSGQGGEVMQGAVRPPGGDWGPPTDLSASEPASGEASGASIALGIDPQGNAVAVWGHQRGLDSVIQSAVYRTG